MTTVKRCDLVFIYFPTLGTMYVRTFVLYVYLLLLVVVVVVECDVWMGVVFSIIWCDQGDG